MQTNLLLFHKCFDQAGHIFRERLCDRDLLTIAGMDKGNSDCVKRLPFDPLPASSVQIIAKQRMTDMAHVDANLMGTAGV
ncbi:hypothetical protein MA20_48105 [Bradyrhizobium japonicum]|uniref:Uncharacterized protein n=1 Tax=Bradyrhizobium japonicum TaxID=375 RepID=A0A0A3XHS3_BRAJP|nr:hypothetical protein MA20_48105 [Bradyrhizobium japonicum]